MGGAGGGAPRISCISLQEQVHVTRTCVQVDAHLPDIRPPSRSPCTFASRGRALVG